LYDEYKRQIASERAVHAANDRARREQIGRRQENVKKHREAARQREEKQRAATAARAKKARRGRFSAEVLKGALIAGDPREKS
jgi:hypothetical protein